MLPVIVEDNKTVDRIGNVQVPYLLYVDMAVAFNSAKIIQTTNGDGITSLVSLGI